MAGTEETQRQYDLAQSACAVIARQYVDSGYCCAIDDAVFPSWPEVGYGKWRAALGPVQHRLIVLLPSFDKVLERNRARSGISRLKESTLRIIYDNDDRVARSFRYGCDRQQRPDHRGNRGGA